MKLAELSEAQLSKAIAEKRWPFLTYIRGQLYYKLDNVWKPFNCTIPNDIFPIWAGLVDEIEVKLLVKEKERAIDWEINNLSVWPLTQIKDATKSTRAMSELILWYYKEREQTYG